MADTSESDSEGDAPPLGIASYDGDAAEVAMLIAANADVDEANDDGCTALYFAAQQGHAH